MSSPGSATGGTRAALRRRRARLHGSPFNILNFPEPVDPGVVYVETRAGSLYLEGQDVRDYGRVFDHLVVTAKGARESRDLTAAVINGK